MTAETLREIRVRIVLIADAAADIESRHVRVQLVLAIQADIDRLSYLPRLCFISESVVVRENLLNSQG